DVSDLDAQAPAPGPALRRAVPPIRARVRRPGRPRDRRPGALAARSHALRAASRARVARGPRAARTDRLPHRPQAVRGARPPLPLQGEDRLDTRADLRLSGAHGDIRGPPDARPAN